MVGPGFNVTRAARIVISSFSGLASNYPYHPEDPVFIQYTIGNTGLADVTPSEPFNVQVNLRAVSAGATDFTSSTLVKSFTPVSNSLFLPAASGQFPNGGSSRVTNFLSLPTERDLLVALSLIPAGTPEDDARVAANVASLANFEFFFEVIEDSTNVIVQSSPSNIFSFTSTFSITATPQQQSAGQYFGQTIFGTFVNSNNAGLSGTTFNGASAADQAFTSLILNYATGQTLAGSPQTLFQSTTQNGFPSLTVLPGGAGTFLTQTFDFNVRADDLTIQVQSSPDLVTWTTLVTLTPPYFGTSGTHSLTGFGGLTDNPFVLSVAGNSTDVQQVYTARVTVRDSVPAVSSGSRFMRLNVVPSVAVPAAPTGLTANYDPTLSESNLSWSASPALPTVLDPLGSGAQITVGAYVIERAAAATPTVFDIVGSTTSTTFSESLAAPTNTTTTYTYRVRAITSGGTSAAASAVETVP